VSALLWENITDVHTYTHTHIHIYIHTHSHTHMIMTVVAREPQMAVLLTGQLEIVTAVAREPQMAVLLTGQLEIVTAVEMAVLMAVLMEFSKVRGLEIATEPSFLLRLEKTIGRPLHT
jgi:hypothetical protein